MTRAAGMQLAWGVIKVPKRGSKDLEFDALKINALVIF